MSLESIGAKKDKKQASTLGQIDCFVVDLMQLASYAVESGRLPDQIKLADIYCAYSQKVEQGIPLTEQEIELLQYYYQLLKLELDPVTPTSLRATECGENRDAMNTDAGKRVKAMWYWAFASLAVILSINLYQYSFEFNSPSWAQANSQVFTTLSLLYWVALALLPFAYGALGASVRLLRVMESRLRDRSFDPRRIPEHRTRWVLGTLSGGVIVMFVSTGGTGDTSVKLTEAALGFLAGYSIDLLFSLLDNLVSILSPSDKTTSQAKQKARIQVPMKISDTRSTLDKQEVQQFNTQTVKERTDIKGVVP